MCSFTTTEAEWDEDERGWMLALARLRKGECSGCGHPLIESTDPANDGRYKVDSPTRCYACNALQVAFEKAKAEDYKHPAALRWGAHLP